MNPDDLKGLYVRAKELAMRVRRVVAAKADAFKLSRNGHIVWREVEIARLEGGEDPLMPAVVVIADEHLAAAEKEKVRERLSAWLTEIIGERLKPLVEIDAAQDIAGLARGIAFRLKENFGVLRRESVAEEIRSLDQPARSQLRKYGVRFGAFNIYFPTMLKPACSELAAVLWVLKHGAQHGLDIAAMPELPRPGLTSVAANAATPDVFYGVTGFHVCGPRAVRVDMLERLADLIRTLLTWRPDPANPGTPPRGATGDGGFRAMPDMMSILGCSAGELGNVLKALGFWAERRKVVPEITAPAAPEAVAAPTPPNDSDAAPAGDASQLPAGEEPRIVVGAPASVPEAAPHSDAAAPMAEPAEPAVEAPEPGAVVAAATVPDAPSVPVAAEANATAVELVVEQFEEVWRPRRKGRAFEAGPERHKQGQRPRHALKGQGFRAQEPRANKPEPQPVPQQGNPLEDKPQQSKPQQGKERHRRPNGRRGGANERPNERHERTRVPLHASPPKPKVAAFDPDSPFAALSSLKAALEKRSQE
jgi:ATP-dependent RNA helicase SUPV3L1/SUV3